MSERSWKCPHCHDVMAAKFMRSHQAICSWTRARLIPEVENIIDELRLDGT
jgi:hypothetical protein